MQENVETIANPKHRIVADAEQLIFPYLNSKQHNAMHSKLIKILTTKPMELSESVIADIKERTTTKKLAILNSKNIRDNIRSVITFNSYS